MGGRRADEFWWDRYGAQSLRITARFSCRLHLHHDFRVLQAQGPGTEISEHITSNVHVEGDFDEAQRKRIAQIATRCPVHKTLTNGTHIDDDATFD